MQAVLELLVAGQCTLENTAVCDECLASTCPYGSHSMCLEDNELYTNATAFALAAASMSYNPGYCTVGGWDGEFGAWIAGVRFLLLKFFFTAIFCRPLLNSCMLA
jgi:hypothetical protein